MTWHAIYGHSDKETDVLDVQRVGKVLQHKAEKEHGGCSIQSHNVDRNQTFQPLFLLKSPYFKRTGQQAAIVWLSLKI